MLVRFTAYLKQSRKRFPILNLQERGEFSQYAIYINLQNNGGKTREKEKKTFSR